MFEKLEIEGLIAITPKRSGDHRGWFSEVFREELFNQHVGDNCFIQHNISHSNLSGTIRGLHFQRDPMAQGKLVSCPRGRVLDVAVDLRKSSPTFGSHVQVELSSENGKQLWVPAGFAHGFCTLEDNCEVTYMVTNYYSPTHDSGLRWNDPALGISWPITERKAVLSEKDSSQPLLAELNSVFA